MIVTVTSISIRVKPFVRASEDWVSMGSVCLSDLCKVRRIRGDFTPEFPGHCSLIVEIILISGRKRAKTTAPTTSARITIMIGSRIEVRAVTALSTSSS